LRVWAVDVTAIWTTFVSLLAVIGVGMLALWAMVSNITARFFIWFWQPLRLGQRIEIFPEALIGEVVEENLMFTELKQDDGAVVVIPNNFFFQRVIRRLPDVGDKKESE
jgi:small-conductance mechanosensitive channel